MSERIVRRASEQLDEPWTVLHSVAWLSPDGPQNDGEADFVFFHPEWGLVVAEVKGGREILLERGNWFSVDRHGDRHAIRNPFEQARRSKHALARFVRGQLGTCQGG